MQLRRGAQKHRLRSVREGAATHAAGGPAYVGPLTHCAALLRLLTGLSRGALAVVAARAVHVPMGQAVRAPSSVQRST